MKFKEEYSIMKQNKSLATNVILLVSVIAVILAIVTPMFFLDYTKGGIHAIWGWTGIFGGSFEITTNGVEQNISCQFNWVLYVNLLLTLVAGATTYFIGPKAKGYYIVGAILFAVVAIINFSTETWLISNSLIPAGGVKYLGVGPWVGGIGAVVSAISCIVAHSFEKNN